MDTRALYIVVENGIPITKKEVRGDLAVSDIYAHVDGIAMLPDLSCYEGSIFEGGIEGDRGGLTIVTPSYILHAYFSADSEHIGDATVRIEVSRVNCEPGEENPPEVVTGMLRQGQLKELIAKLDANDEPLEFAESRVAQPLGG